jgi:hypothetical protein
MAADALVDTGAILALLDRTDRWHVACVDAFRRLRLPLVTSDAVLTELFHLPGESRQEMESAWKFIRSGAIRLAVIEGSELPEIQTLMSRYWDRPMDFAEATLVIWQGASVCLRSLPPITLISVLTGLKLGNGSAYCRQRGYRLSAPRRAPQR